ncbi:virulence factor family protein [Pseudorhodoferax sp.]|uniref:virulence factor family protein n=1 Tax=Pseudorhodoferax sp. TaxID=1993553 RepID=UPI002DD683FA|nr:AcvB/VirJ family lysyl-phosphatidylglycerol hydrolase [Pseudorhodoferax sp.]
MKSALSLTLLFAAGAALAQAPPPVQSITHGQFERVQVHSPSGPVRQFALLLIEGQAASAQEQAMRSRLLAGGAMVAEVSMAAYQAKVRAQKEQCGYAGGDFENLARHIQAMRKLPAYFESTVVGAGDYAAYAYGMVAQAPAGSFGALLTSGFCPRLVVQPPLCAVNKLSWRAGQGPAVDMAPAAIGIPWMAAPADGPAACDAAAAQAFVAQVPQARTLASFDAAAAAIAAQRPLLEAAPAQLADLPVVEVPTQQAGTRFAVLMSGDGGWAGIDKEIAAALARQGVPVAGFDSLRYFWSKRTPEGLAADLDRLVRHYAARWQRSEVILIGFSQGADVLPFALNRLPERTRAAVRLSVLLAPSEKASFEFHVSNWLGPSGDKPVLPEAQKLQAARTLCVHGSQEKRSLCPQLAPAHAQVLMLQGGHHFDGDYAALADRILRAAGP